MDEDKLLRRDITLEDVWSVFRSGPRVGPFVAMPPEAGAARDFWLAVPERRGAAVRIGVEAAGPDATFEAVTAGLGVHLLAEGNAALYARTGVICRPVRGLSPCSLVVAWRAGDDRRPVRAFVQACSEARGA